MWNYKMEDAANWILATASTTGLVGWFLGRRRTNAETKGVEIDNEEKETFGEIEEDEILFREK